MRRVGKWLAVAVAVAGTAGCSPGLLSGGMQLNPGCGAMQARSHNSTAQWYAGRQQVAAIQSRYSPGYQYARASVSSKGWKSLSSGECR